MPCRRLEPATKARASTSEVFPEALWPTNATFRTARVSYTFISPHLLCGLLGFWRRNGGLSNTKAGIPWRCRPRDRSDRQTVRRSDGLVQHVPQLPPADQPPAFLIP